MSDVQEQMKSICTRYVDSEVSHTDNMVNSPITRLQIYCGCTFLEDTLSDGVFVYRHPVAGTYILHQMSRIQWLPKLSAGISY